MCEVRWLPRALRWPCIGVLVASTVVATSVVFAVSAAAAVPGPPSAPVTPAPPVATTLTLAATPTSVLHGGTVTLTGRLQRVDIAAGTPAKR
jgi:hypothetical protein